MRVDARQLTKSITAHMTGRTERGRDECRRLSYRQDTPEARPWSPIGDGSTESALAHCEAIEQAADELRHQQWLELPNAKVRDARDRRGDLAAELQMLDRLGSRAPAGKSATIRRELVEIDAVLLAARNRLREADVGVLRALLRIVPFDTGELYPTIGEIANKAGRSRTATVASLRRLHANGFVDWHRRTKPKPGAEGTFGPQLEQTSSAYFFDWLRSLARRARLRFEQLLARKLRKAGKPMPSPQAPNRPGRSAAASNEWERRGISAELAKGLDDLQVRVWRNAST